MLRCFIVVVICVGLVLLHETRRIDAHDKESEEKIPEDNEKYEEMVTLDGGHYWKGIQDKSAKDGSFPPLLTFVGKFKINKYPITNFYFRKFVVAEDYKTTAEEYDWSFVFESDVPDAIKATITDSLPNAEWWVPVPNARWDQPEGEGSIIDDRLNWPAVHISHIDAEAYCKWKGLRLPTDHEWEFAARGTLIKKKYPWGDTFEKRRMNLWQGKFPKENKALDGYPTVAPVDAYPPQNDYGMYDMLGNVWEWTSDVYKQSGKGKHQYTLRGGSFVDSKGGSFNHKARTAMKMGNEPDAGSNNLGFRCAIDIPVEGDEFLKDEL